MNHNHTSLGLVTQCMLIKFHSCISVHMHFALFALVDLHAHSLLRENCHRNYMMLQHSMFLFISYCCAPGTGW